MRHAGWRSSSGRSSNGRSWFGAAGALLASASVALAAHASHAPLDAEAQRRLMVGAAFAFGHGLALAALAPVARRTLARVALFALLLGMLCFSGSLVAAVFAGTTTRLAPAGGLSMIAGWLLFAVDRLRR